MNRKRLRNGAVLAFAAISASVSAPRLARIARTPIHIDTAELAATNVIADAVERVSDNISESHLGFDTNVYPGDKAMAAWKESDTYEWVGYYLEAPCHKDDSWKGTRERLSGSGWGLAVIYVGQQTWGKKNPAAVTPTPKPSSHRSRSRRSRTMTRKSGKPVAAPAPTCSAGFVNAARGKTDALDAIAKSGAEGFDSGTVVFLDVERMPTLPTAMRDYYRAWTQTLLDDGRYRPGIYAHTYNAAAIFDDISDLYTKAGITDDPPFWVAGSRGFSIESTPADVGHAFASAWQGVLDVVREHSGVRLPIDISVSRHPSPSETRK